MRRLLGKSWRPANAVLIVLLLVAQTWAIAHAYDHEPEILQDATCVSCVALNQLGATCVDSGAGHDCAAPGSDRYAVSYVTGESIRTLTCRQRGPPISL
jgi:hypothetical protein